MTTTLIVLRPIEQSEVEEYYYQAHEDARDALCIIRQHDHTERLAVAEAYRDCTKTRRIRFSVIDPYPELPYDLSFMPSELVGWAPVATVSEEPLRANE